MVASAVVAGASIYGAVKQDEAINKQEKEMKRQQREEAAEIATQKKEALEERKTGIDLLRRQMFGSGDKQGFKAPNTMQLSGSGSQEVLG